VEPASIPSLEPAPVAAGPAATPSPWPELPASDASGEMEDGLLRRLDRQHRIAREQRGD